MAAEQILKSWLRQKYTDNNTLRTRYNSGDSLTVPDTSNSLADDTDINTLVTSLRKMQSNTYLRYSPLWSSVNINNVAQGDLIAQTKKTSIDKLIENNDAKNMNDGGSQLYTIQENLFVILCHTTQDVNDIYISDDYNLLINYACKK